MRDLSFLLEDYAYAFQACEICMFISKNCNSEELQTLQSKLADTATEKREALLARISAEKAKAWRQGRRERDASNDHSYPSCPFCGGIDVVYSFEVGQMSCHICGVATPVKLTRNRALEIWGSFSGGIRK